jgi:hypothetical protein
MTAQTQIEPLRSPADAGKAGTRAFFMSVRVTQRDIGMVMSALWEAFP